MMFERHDEEVATKPVFVFRLVKTLAIILAIIFVSLLMGTLGYHYLGELPWFDALHNAAMILTGMGPVDPMRSTAAKLFVIGYSLYSAVAFLTMVTVLMTPVLHRVLHNFHKPRTGAGSDQHNLTKDC